MSNGRLLIDILDERDRLRALVADDDDNNFEIDDIDEDDEFLLNLQDEYQSDLDFLEQSHRCILCGFNYQPKMNMENYFCRMHVGIIYTDDTWSCCNQPRGTAGCRPSMHVHTPDLVASMQHNAANSILEIPVDLINYNLIYCNLKMITNYSRGGDPALILVKDDRGVLKRLEGKFYRLQRVAVHERIL